jgi:endonuclease YncB( thermonuclease family)
MLSVFVLTAASSCSAIQPEDTVQHKPERQYNVQARGHWRVKLDDSIAIDGDTLIVIATGLPDRISRMQLDIAGIDAPELPGRCPAEQQLGERARDLVKAVFSGTSTVEIDAVRWGTRGGHIEGSALAPGGGRVGSLLVSLGLARRHLGGPRGGWCG